MSTCWSRIWILVLSSMACAFGAGCPRFAAGATAVNPPALYSSNGSLTVNLAYNTATDADGRTLYCFTTPDGTESPTLYVNPGDLLVVNVVNNLPAPTAASAMRMATNAKVCGASMMDASSVNIHYHGTNVSPACHADEVIHTLINSGQSFTYAINFPESEPPGLYWYHPHVHGISEPALQGGASGAIVVQGVENIQPGVAGLPERVLLVRDQPVAGDPTPGGTIPSWDLTLNYIPISYPALTPAVIQMQYARQEFWRVANQSADTILDLEVLYDGTPQTLMLVALDGVPVGSQDGARQGKLLPVTDMRLPPAARAEFLLTGPSESVRSALFLTQSINTGPDGDNDTERTLARIVGATEPVGTTTMPAASTGPSKPLFHNLQDGPVTAHRKLYFSENDDQTAFFITVDGQKPAVFSPDNKPAITTVQGSVEEWTIENRAMENHEFHFHQLHFTVVSQDNFEVNGSQPVTVLDRQFVDMIEVPFWDGNPDHPYPSVTVRMDFRGADVGDFVYHCHILNHEDQGMMAIVRVLPATNDPR